MSSHLYCEYCIHFDIENASNGVGYCDYHHGKMYIDEYCQNFEERQTENNSGCFITTACVDYFGHDDKGNLLEDFRRFRDQRLKIDPELNEIVRDYYLYAPKIVSRIDSLDREDRRRQYERIYEEMIIPCHNAMLNSNDSEVVQIYLQHFRALKQKYIDN